MMNSADNRFNPSKTIMLQSEISGLHVLETLITPKPKKSTQEKKVWCYIDGGLGIGQLGIMASKIKTVMANLTQICSSKSKYNCSYADKELTN